MFKNVILDRILQLARFVITALYYKDRPNNNMEVTFLTDALTLPRMRETIRITNRFLYAIGT